jgi:hypothetical protein
LVRFGLQHVDAQEPTRIMAITVSGIYLSGACLMRREHDLR